MMFLLNSIRMGSIEPPLPHRGKLILLANNRWLLLGSLMLFALALNREGDRMPSGNEFVYLLYFFKAWHPLFLSSDWTFQETTAGHAVFNIATGWLTRLMPLPGAAWLGRIVCWAATFAGLFRVGRHFKIPPWGIWVGIMLWLLQRQSAVTGEWMVGTFEAKTVAYPLLLFAIDAVLTDRILSAGIFTGLAFSFHSAVGMWGGAALGFSVLAFYPIRKTLQFSAEVILFSLPGLITSLPLIMGKNSISLTEAKYLTTVALSDCFDVAQFPHTAVALPLVFPFFAFLHLRWQKNDRRLCQLLVFEIGLAIFFAFGIVARIVGRFDWVELFPMRVYAVFAMLLFFWRAMSILIALMHRDVPRPCAVLCTACLLLAMLMPTPVLQLRDLLASRLTKYLHPSSGPPDPSRGDSADFVQAATWISTHTDPTDPVIAPPWRNDGFYYIRRPLVANWHAPRYDRMSEWKNRLESLVGDTSRPGSIDTNDGEMDKPARDFYDALSPAQIRRIQDLYFPDHKAKWLLTTGRYPYPVAFATPTFCVYRLP